MSETTPTTEPALPGASPVPGATLPGAALPKLSKRAKWTMALTGFLVLFGAGQVLRYETPLHYGFSIDPQYQTCLPWSNFLVEYQKPKQVHVGELLLFYDHRINVISKSLKKVDAPGRAAPGRLAPGTGLAHGDTLASIKKQNILVVKYVAALPGQKIRIQKDGSVFIDGRYWGKRWLVQWAKMRHLKILKPGVYTVQKNHVLMLGTTAGSYDGRYWGTVPDKDILGRAWTL